MTANPIPIQQFEVILAAVLSIGMVTTVTVLAWQAGPYLLPAMQIETLRPLFIETYRSHINPEPLERFAYLIAVVATYPAVIFSIWTARFLARRDVVPSWSRHVLLAGLSLSLFGFVVGSDTFGYLVNGVPHIVGRPWAMALLLVAIGLSVGGLFAVSRYPESWVGSLLLQQTGRLTFVVIAALLMTSLAPRFRSADMIAGDGHFEAVFYSVSQVMAGKTLLSDLPAQYGLYGELLAPIWWITGHSVLAFTAIMVVLQLIATFCILVTVRALIRLDVVFVICALTLLWLVGSLWSTTLITVEGSEYYQVWPLRFVFPALAIFLFFQTMRSPFGGRHAMGLGAFSGLAVIWNLDSGVPVTGAFLAFFVSNLIFGPTRWRHLRIASIFVAAFTLTGMCFLAYLSLKAATSVHLEEWIKYQSIFYSVGFGMLPMKPWGAWISIYGLYVTALAAGLYRAANKSSNETSNLLIFLSVLGIGLFTYFQGRSHPKVLAFVGWPAVIIAFVFAEKFVRAASMAKLKSHIVGWYSLPALVIGVALSLAWATSVPKLMTATYDTVRTIIKNPDSRADAAIEFIKEKVGQDDSAAIIAHAQGAYLAEAGLSSAFPGPGLFEIVLQEDRDAMMRFLNDRPVKHLFIQTHRAPDRPAVYDDLLPPYDDLFEQYVVADRFGTLLYLTPKQPGT